MTTGELAKKLGVPRSTIIHWINQGHIVSTRLPKSPFSQQITHDVSDEEYQRIQPLVEKWLQQEPQEPNV